MLGTYGNAHGYHPAKPPKRRDTYQRFNSASSLATGLISYWKLDETSGARQDSAGANALTDVNGVGRNTGQLNYAADFTAANQKYLSIADNASLSTGHIDFSLGAWVYLTDNSVSRGILSKSSGGSASTIEYSLDYYRPLDAFRLLVSDGTNLTAVWSSAPPALNTWY